MTISPLKMLTDLALIKGVTVILRPLRASNGWLESPCPKVRRSVAFAGVAA